MSSLRLNKREEQIVQLMREGATLSSKYFGYKYRVSNLDESLITTIHASTKLSLQNRGIIIPSHTIENSIYYKLTKLGENIKLKHY